MPFTPFHMGPGVAIKALLQGSFSLLVFGWTQIVIDLQPLIAILSRQGHVHGITHTYLGATLIGLFSGVTGKYLGKFFLLALIGKTRTESAIGWGVALISGLLGSYSHVLLDSLMHRDIQPFYPFSNENGLLGLVDSETVYEGCVYVGLAGGLLYAGIQYGLSRRRLGKGE